MGTRVNTTAFALTERERQIHELRAQGLTHRQVAARLHISEKSASRLAQIARDKVRLANEDRAWPTT